MQNTTLRNLVLAAILVGGLAAQTQPAAIDNEQVRVLLVTDQPHAKGKPHEHPLNRVMIYLQPGRQEITLGGKKTTATWKAGEARWSPATGTHTSEIVSDAPVSIVELEVKKPGDPAKTAKTALDPLKVAPRNYTLEFENSQVRVFRVKMAPHQPVPLHEHALSRVVIYITDQNTSATTPDGKTEVSKHKAGEVSWGGPLKHQEANLSDKPFEAVVVEFKN